MQEVDVFQVSGSQPPDSNWFLSSATFEPLRTHIYVDWFSRALINLKPVFGFLYITKAATPCNRSLLSAKTDFIQFHRNIHFRGMPLYPHMFLDFYSVGYGLFLIVSQFFSPSDVLTIMFLFLKSFLKHQIYQEGYIYIYISTYTKKKLK